MALESSRYKDGDTLIHQIGFFSSPASIPHPHTLSFYQQPSIDCFLTLFSTNLKTFQNFQQNFLYFSKKPPPTQCLLSAPPTLLQTPRSPPEALPLSTTGVAASTGLVQPNVRLAPTARSKTLSISSVSPSREPTLWQPPQARMPTT